ncbi:MAG: MFS transporter [Ktedonobacterales bacterium]|nr:MFS transporter [Ktedonobacterales bacterium]
MAGAALTRGRRARRWRGALLDFDRNVHLLLLFTLGKGFQLSIAALSINLYVHSLGYRLDFIGLIAAMPALGSLLSAVPAGFLADRWGRKPLLILSGLLNPLALVAIGLSTSAPFLLAASFMNGVLSSAYWVINVPMLTESTREDQRVWVLSLNNFLLLGVGAFGSLIGGAVPEVVSRVAGVSAVSTVALRWGVLTAAIAVFLPALPLAFLTEPRRDTEHPALASAPAIPAGAEAAAMAAEGRATSAETVPAPAETVDAAVGDERAGRWATVALFLKLLVPDALYSTGEGAAIGLLQLFFLLRFGLRPGALGAFYTSAGLLSGVTSLLAPRIVRRWGKLRTATAMQILSVPVVLGIGFSPIFPFAAAAEYGRNMLRGLFEPVYAAFAMERVPSRQRATLSGFYSVTWSIGFSIGPALAGWLQQNVGLSAAFVVSAICIGAAAILLRLFFGGAR